MNFPTRRQFFDAIDKLVNSWCERRCLDALRFILKGYPLANQLGDDWAILLECLGNVRAFASHQLTKHELEIIDLLYSDTEIIIHQGGRFTQ